MCCIPHSPGASSRAKGGIVDVPLPGLEVVLSMPLTLFPWPSGCVCVLVPNGDFRTRCVHVLALTLHKTWLNSVDRFVGKVPLGLISVVHEHLGGHYHCSLDPTILLK